MDEAENSTPQAEQRKFPLKGTVHEGGVRLVTVGFVSSVTEEEEG